ncbi:MAG TPA: 3-oxoacyl-[acyl-carrier-protein] synthase III C-terminal domain-containing protein [Kofleriaceae bacterium]|nr:3-oxoacyl-[acyl-carrier-protein] synthase III C-terminal domain-containing protein [Kofleriaceae bacterium]
MALLTRFVSTRPPYMMSQAHSLDWLARAHAQSEASLAGLDLPAREAFTERMARLLERVACSTDRIATRGSVLPDFTMFESDGSVSNLLYDDPRAPPGQAVHPHGRGVTTRVQLFARAVDAYFARQYGGDCDAPDDLIHVTCTGYVAPSGAQKVVAARGWGARTRVTHAYHMGCYAAMPAVRIAAGFLASGSEVVDIVHTELCSLHLDPADHRLDQLVVQSLFGDGMIRYSVIADEGGPGLLPLAACEAVIPDSADAMRWVPSEWGMQMALARDVPDRIAKALRGFVLELYRRAELGLDALGRSVFAVHPGGPKILDRVREVLELDPAQVRTSCEVLRDHGNMSSATLPHIWMRLLGDRRVPSGTLIPSLAFGPGLTVAGVLLEKQ